MYIARASTEKDGFKCCRAAIVQVGTGFRDADEAWRNEACLFIVFECGGTDIDRRRLGVSYAQTGEMRGQRYPAGYREVGLDSSAETAGAPLCGLRLRFFGAQIVDAPIAEPRSGVAG